MPTFILSERAKKDIAEIWRYTVDEWSPDQAERYYNDLIDACDRIASNDSAIARNCDDIRPGLQSITCAHHVIFFRVIASGKVRIVRILHERMDFPRHI